MTDNQGSRIDRLPAAAADRDVAGRATREEVLDYWDERFAVPPAVFDEYTFWEKGAGTIWALRGAVASPVEIETLGMRMLRTRQEHWKPTTNAVQRFGRHAARNVLELDPEAAATFVRGEDQAVDWDGDWGYLVVARELAGGVEPLGVGLYLRGELRSQIPKGRRLDLEP